MPKRDTAQGHETIAPPDDAIARLKADHHKVRTLLLCWPLAPATAAPFPLPCAQSDTIRSA